MFQKFIYAAAVVPGFHYPAFYSLFYKSGIKKKARHLLAGFPVLGLVGFTA